MALSDEVIGNAVMMLIIHDILTIMPSPIQIKRPDVAMNIRELAALTKSSITDAIGNAVRSQLAIERVKANAELTKKRKAADLVLAELRSLPVLGPDLSDEDLYNSEGLPK